jgi:stage II sporulation protein E
MLYSLHDIDTINKNWVGVGVLAEQAPSKIQKYYWPDLTTSSPLLSSSAARSSISRLKIRTEIFKSTATFIFVFIMSRAMLPTGIFPGAAPCVFAQRRNGYLDQILNGVAVFIGTYSVTNLVNALWISISLFFLNFFLLLCQHTKQLKYRGLYFFAVWSIWRLASSMFQKAIVATFFQVVIELGIGLCLLIFFEFGFDFLANRSKISKWSTIGLAVIAGVGLSGITGMRFYSLQVAEAALVFLLTIIAYLGGGGAGLVMGIIVAAISGLANGSIITKLALFGMAGVLAIVLNDFGKWGIIGGACLSFYLLSGRPQWELATNSQLLSWGVGMTGFAIMPRRLLTRFLNYLPEQVENTNVIERQRRLKEIISSRISGIANIFEEMAKNFNAAAAESDVAKIDLYSLLDQVCSENCRYCNNYEICWEKNFYTTYRELFDLIAYAELYGQVGVDNLKGKLRQNCYQQYKLITTVNHLFEKFQHDLFWRRKYETSKSVITCQLQGMAVFMADLAAEVTNDRTFKDGVESSIKYSLNKLGVTIREVVVSAFGTEGLEIKICQKGCRRNRECQNLIAPLLDNILGQKYMLWDKRCCLEAGYCNYVLIPESKYEVLTTVCRLPKNGNLYSGDNHALHQLKDGHFVAILSDGMGHGPKAAEESRITVSVLERLLENGISRDFAVQMVNSMMSLRTPEESFATVDLTLVDLYTAKVEFIKIGAAATYIKRGREVWPIKSTSLPAGILNTVDVERTVSQLQAGDLIIMATDGVVDSKEESDTKEEDWLARALSKVEVVGPEALGEYLLNLAMINQDGQPKDDMTVVVLQVDRREDAL